MRPDPEEGLSYESLAANSPRSLGDDASVLKGGTWVAHHSIHYKPPTPWVDGITNSMDMSLSKLRKGPSSQGYGFSSGHVWMWELDCEENWVLKNWCFWIVVLEKTPESPLECKDIQPVHSKGDQPWDFFGRNDAKAETPVLWPPHAKSWLIGKDSDAGKD